jgi:Glycosyl hydrolase family 26
MAVRRLPTAVLAGLLVVALMAVAGIVELVTHWNTTGDTSYAAAPIAPAHGAYFGARVRPPVETQPAAIAAVQGLQQEIGRRLALVHDYLEWQGPFPTASDLAFVRQGSLLQLSWAGADTRAIASGKYDSYIRKEALAMKAVGKRILLEWRSEMNRPGLQAQVHSPADFIAAWDHIRSIFAAEQVNNVIWVWCPSAYNFADGGAAYYPGDSQVDWICADVYPGPGPYRSFAAVAQPFLNWASHRPKPILIGEYGVPQTYGPVHRAQWLMGAARTVQADPQIKALSYFDGNTQRPYALDAGSPALQAFRSIAQMPYFNPAIPPAP